MFTITKKYYFYAAHRNPEGGEKCGRIHGHTYDIEVDLSLIQPDDSSVTMLFQEIDSHLEPLMKKHDHIFLLWEQDPLVEVLELHNEPFLKLPFMTSAENLCLWLGTNIMGMGLPITRISLGETRSSIVTLRFEDGEVV